MKDQSASKFYALCFPQSPDVADFSLRDEGI